MNDRPQPELPAGTPVEVHSNYSQSWTPGFEVVSVGPDGFQLRRVSDRSVLPVAFRTRDIRPRHRP